VDKLTLELLACIGLCLVLKYGSILNFIRDRLTRIKFFKDLFACSLCIGIWVGFFVGVYTGRDILLMSFASSFVCWLADHVILLLKEKIWPT
jgi:predicted PurR-regulated permease PerM